MPRVDAPQDLQTFVRDLRADGLLFDVHAEVDSKLEVAEIHRRVLAAEGPALVFWDTNGGRFPLVTNLFGTRERVERALGRRADELVQRMVDRPQEFFPPTASKLMKREGTLSRIARIRTRAVTLSSVARNVERPPHLSSLPATQAWRTDIGRYLPRPLVVTQDPVTRRTNLGTYRAQVFDDGQLGLHLGNGSGAALHLAAAEERGHPLTVHVHLGGPPAAQLAALAPRPESFSETVLASLLLGRPLSIKRDPGSKLPYLADAEIVLQGSIDPGARRLEGPFGDRYGYVSAQSSQPVMRVERMMHRKDALFPTTVLGKPQHEESLLLDRMQELFAPTVPLFLSGVRELWCHTEAGHLSLATAIVRERYPREAMTNALRLVGESQLASTKLLLVTDGAVDLRDFRAVLTHVLARCDCSRDLVLLGNLAASSLDPSSDGTGSKGVLIGVGDPIRSLPTEFTSPMTYAARRVRVFSPGCVVVEAPGFAGAPDIARTITKDPGFDGWPLVILTDDVDRATSSVRNLLWTTFTRFDPARDISARNSSVVTNHVSYTAPIVLDARRKTDYPEELIADPETESLVERRWGEYFPTGSGVELGPARNGQLVR